MADYRGRFLWYELQTTAPMQAQDFYRRINGWTTEAWPGAGHPYTILKRGDTGIGGVMELPAEARQAGAPPHWLAYVGTPDIDGTVRQATGMGATALLEPIAVPTVGRIAVLQDPQGAVFGLYQPEREPDPPRSPDFGDCTWHELATTDTAEAWRFYSTLFGWEKHGAGHDMGDIGIYQEYGLPGLPFPLGGIYRKPAAMLAPPHFMLYFHLADLPAAVAEVKALGGQVIHGPMEIPHGDWIVTCLDPQGAAFSLHQSSSSSSGARGAMST
jgi:predicted enzyme related to lactoylglutathione lyase